MSESQPKPGDVVAVKRRVVKAGPHSIISQRIDAAGFDVATLAEDVAPWVPAPRIAAYEAVVEAALREVRMYAMFDSGSEFTGNLTVTGPPESWRFDETTPPPTIELHAALLALAATREENR